jgi:RNA polymerase primary sigma factor
MGLEAVAMKRKRSADSETEAVTLEPLPSRSLFGEIPEQIRPSRSDYNEDEIDEPIEDFELEGEELGSEEEREIEREQFLRGKAPSYPEDITCKYLKGLEKVSLLTPTQEVTLAKKIKQGEHQIKLLETRVSRLKARSKNNLKKSKPSPTETKERTLLYKKALTEYQQAVLETQKAKNDLIQANLRLVISIAKRYANKGTPFGDLIQEGNIGLIQALVRFDYRKGYKFSTYASWWIRAAILRAFAEKSRTIRIPNYLFEIKGKLRGSFKSLMKKLGREPSSEELSKDTGIPLQDVEKILNLAAEPVSLNMPIGEESSTLEDLIADEQSASPSDLSLKQDLIYHTRKLLASLSPREEKILRLRFGIENSGECTLGEIGRQFGLSRERIRQIEAKAIERLRNPNGHKQIREYIE